MIAPTNTTADREAHLDSYFFLADLYNNNAAAFYNPLMAASYYNRILPHTHEPYFASNVRMRLAELYRDNNITPEGRVSPLDAYKKLLEEIVATPLPEEQQPYYNEALYGLAELYRDPENRMYDLDKAIGYLEKLIHLGGSSSKHNNFWVLMAAPTLLELYVVKDPQKIDTFIDDVVFGQTDANTKAHIAISLAHYYWNKGDTK